MDPEDPDSDPDHSQNIIISSFYLFRHILKISSKSVHEFFCYLVHKQTNKSTNPGENITSLAEVIINVTLAEIHVKSWKKITQWYTKQLVAKSQDLNKILEITKQCLMARFCDGGM